MTKIYRLIPLKIINFFALYLCFKMFVFAFLILNKNVVCYLNTKHWNIKFTFEFDENNSFAFLDIQITRIDNKVFKLVFRKNIFLVFLLLSRAFYLLNMSLAYLTHWFTDSLPFVFNIKNFMKGL